MKKTAFHLPLLIAGIGLSLLSCHIPLSAPTVLVTGYAFVDGYQKAVVWKNNARQVLEPGPSGSYGYALTVVNGHILVAGTIGAPGTSCYWLDGHRTDMPLPGNLRHPTEVVVGDGGMCFSIGGNMLDNMGYWQNGFVPIGLPAGIITGLLSSLKVYRGKVYCAGTCSDSMNFRGYYWTGTTPSAPLESLYGGNTAANSIYVNENGILIGGYCYDLSNNRPCYWVGDSLSDPVILPLAAGQTAGDINAIHMYKGVLYAAGGATDCLCLWTVPDPWNATTSGPPVVLPTPENDGRANSVFVHEGDVYVAGSYSISGFFYACYWKNGRLIDLPESEIGSGDYATSIYVK